MTKDTQTPTGPLGPSAPRPLPAHRPTILHTRVVAGAGGGPDKTIMRSPAYVDPQRVRMVAAYIHPEGDPGIDVIRNHAAQHNAELHTIAERGALDVRTCRRMLALCKKLNVDVWHGHDYKTNVLGLLLRRFHPMRLVTTAHGWTHESARTRLYYRIDNLCLPRYEQVVAVSPPLEKHCRKIGVNASRLTYIPNGIELADYVPQPRESHDTFDIGVVGRLSVEKGVDRAIDTVATLRRKYPHIRLHLVGDGPERKNLERQARDMGVYHNVIFHGWQKQTLPFYNRFDMLLLPSHTEGLPNVVLEAMAMNVPVAATNVGGVSDLLNDGQCGVLMQPEETDAWALVIAPLIVSAARRDELARRARLRVRERFTFAKRMQRMCEVYDRVLETPISVPLRRAA